jgi:GNAT superfamily N-acetyltransferase
MTAIRDASEDDWELLRAIRLDALLNAPRAFVSTHAREAEYNEWQWREWLRRDLWLLAFADLSSARPIGIIAATQEPMEPCGEPFISSLWVNPEHRMRGIAKELIRAAADRVAARGAIAVSLWVLDGNEHAHKLYTAMGFVGTNDHQIAPGHSSLMERRMSKSLL